MKTVKVEITSVRNKYGYKSTDPVINRAFHYKVPGQEHAYLKIIDRAINFYKNNFDAQHIHLTVDNEYIVDSISKGRVNKKYYLSNIDKLYEKIFDYDIILTIERA